MVALRLWSCLHYWSEIREAVRPSVQLLQRHDTQEEEEEEEEEQEQKQEEDLDGNKRPSRRCRRIH